MPTFTALEAEAIIKPSRALLFNLNASYLHTKVTTDKFLANTQDPSGGRADAVIIKDLQFGNNCAVVSNAGVAAQSNGFVTAVNAGARACARRRAIPGTNTTGAFSLCSVLTAATANPAAGVTGAAGRRHDEHSRQRPAAIAALQILRRRPVHRRASATGASCRASI